MNKDKLIVTQVAFKGAVDLVVAGKLELDEITSFMESHTENMMKNAPAGDVNVFPKQRPASAGNRPNMPSQKQVSYIFSLLKEVPKADADKISPTVAELSGKQASELIEKLISMKDSMTPEVKTPKDDSEPPF